MAWRTAFENDTVIRLQAVSVRYRVPRERVATLKEHAIRLAQRRLTAQDFFALRDVNLDVMRGQVVGLIGKNGAGKSTLLKVIARVLRPTQGRVWVKGQVAPLLEFGAGFHPELTGRENVFLNGALLGFSRAQMNEKFARIVEFAELGDFIDAPLRTYSSGMVARLGFAVATDIEPQILILDEVLSVGDAAFQKKSFERIQSFRASGATILFVTHNLDAVKKMCTRAVWLDQGRVVADGSPEAILDQYLARDQVQEAHRLADQLEREPQTRWGTRQIEITRVRLTDAHGAEKTIFQTGDTLVLHLDYLAHHPIAAPVFGMAIHRQDGLHVAGPNTAFDGLTLPTLQGAGSISFTLARLPLLEGLYTISVAVVNQDDSEMFDYHDRAYPFRVENDPSTQGERYGAIALRGEWTLNA